MSSFPVLITGHSQAKYFKQYLSLSGTNVLSHSGFRIDQMFNELQPTIDNYNTVVLHVGANDLSRGSSVKTLLRKYQQLTSDIWHSNPTADIIISGVLPRADNQFPGALVRTNFLTELNQRARLLNTKLQLLATRVPRLHYVGHPSFAQKGTIKRHLLSRDGLHLSYRGSLTVVKDIENAIRHLRKTKDTHDSIWDLPTPTPTSTPKAPTPMPDPTEPAVDQTLYRTALLTLPIRTPTPKSVPTSTGIQVIEEWPALPRHVPSHQILFLSHLPPLLTACLPPLLTAHPHPLLTACLTPILTACLPPLLTACLPPPLLTACLPQLLTACLPPLLTACLPPLLTAHPLPLLTVYLPPLLITHRRLLLTLPSIATTPSVNSPVTTTPTANTPPVLIGGGVSLFSYRSYSSECHWKCDQYQWLHYGSKSVTINSVVLEKKFYKIRLPGSKGQIEGRGRNRAVGSLQFKRTAYNFKDNRNLVLVHYEGDETVYTPLSHGNVKNKINPPEFIRTAPSVLQTIEKEVSSGLKTAMDVYRDNITNSDIPGVQQGVLNARNVKQVENIVRKVNEQKRIGKDDIYNLMLLAYHMEGYIHEITVFPDLTAIIALPEMISIVNQLLDVNTEEDIPFQFFYDTTFKLGDFYVSPLVFRNIIFEDRPIMPVAFLIHGRKKEKMHSKFFEFVSSVFPKLNRKCVPFVTDREPGLVNAIEKNFPNSDVIMCWNHLITDAKFNLHKMGADQENIAFYLSNI
ncbi:unnamed protein product [Mytilus coruscus]|uniref:SGNH hydrolase-type esterase domain-containing protein n=1 Tax=Mytilus coruscus TaxID=42192 RepID=A0A6J8DXM8_MYTCO|nr:unnamed protein product [Mytilus coruscus]